MTTLDALMDLRDRIPGWTGIPRVDLNAGTALIFANREALLDVLERMEASQRDYQAWTIASPRMMIAYTGASGLYALVFTDETDAVHVRLLIE